ncbi:beta-phosphoglucomutase [Bacillus sp. 2205SS5-2]|uniref:beta-phosphoglucomutase n=1 Tax=Bacillus sp. 2205SS5-2 TaxID=3109031 RepID=UPI003007E07C
MKSSIKAVIFDLDGVIVDTVHYYYLATKKVANEMGAVFSEEDNLFFQGKSRSSLIKELADRSPNSYQAEEKQAFGEKRNAGYQTYINQMNSQSIFPGVLSFLEELKTEGIATALASSSSNAQRVLKQVGLAAYFDVVVDPQTLANGKPDPEIFLTAASLLGVEPRDCVAIEDGEAGLTGILATDMYSIGVGDYPYLAKSDWSILSMKELTLSRLLVKFQQKR